VKIYLKDDFDCIGGMFLSMTRNFRFPKNT